MLVSYVYQIPRVKIFYQLLIVRFFWQVAFDCLNNQARMEDAILMHCDACTYAHKCKSKHYNPGVCSAYRLKSCIAALPPSHYLSHER